MKNKINNEVLLASAISELRFANLQTELLRSALENIEVFTTDNLAKMTIKNSLKQYYTDKLIHARLLFKK